MLWWRRVGVYCVYVSAVCKYPTVITILQIVVCIVEFVERERKELERFTSLRIVLHEMTLRHVAFVDTELLYTCNAVVH